MARGNGKRLTVAAALAAAAAMVALVVASVPLYQLFCRVTGYGGTTQVAPTAPGAVSERTMTVRFDSNVMKDVPWRFRPMQGPVTVRLGEETLVYFEAENLSDQPVTGSATFNVAPAKAGPYFAKIECFCFTEQRLEPGQRIEMPVSFFVDPGIAVDATTDEVRTITLSYTFFRATADRGQGAVEKGTKSQEDRS